MAKIPLGSALKGGGGMLRFIKFGFLSFFLLYLLITIAFTAIEQRDAGIVVKELGEEFYSPLQTAQEFAIEIQGKEATGLLESIWKYWGFYFHLYKLYLWIRVLMWIIKFIGGDRLSPMERILLAFIAFSVIQLLFAAYILKEGPNYIFIAFKDIFQGIVHIFTNINFQDGAENIFESNNDCNGGPCVI